MIPIPRSLTMLAIALGLAVAADVSLLAQNTSAKQPPEFKVSTVDLGEPYADLSEVDLNGDGKKDLLFTTSTRPLRWRVAMQIGPNEFELSRDIPIPANCSAIALADWNSQPGEDIIALSAEGYEVISAISKTRETSVKLPLLLPPGRHQIPKHWAWGEDVNGDGRQDLLLPGRSNDWLVLGRTERKRQSPRISLAIPIPSEQNISTAAGGMLEVRTKKPRAEFAHTSSAKAFEPVFMTSKGLWRLPMSGDESALSIGKQPDLLFPVTLGSEVGLGLLRRTDVDLVDLNYDGKADLVLTRTEATAGVVPARRTDLLFFLNELPPTGRPSQVLRLPGVLSNGPDLIDVNGDGAIDLVLSVFAGDMKSEISRRLLGRVRLEWHIYLGHKASSSRGVVQRSPSLTLTDQVPLERFQTWGLRHRRVPTEDWNGDGLADLITFEADSNNCAVMLSLGSANDEGKFAFARTPYATATIKAAIRDHTVVSIAGGMPSARLKTNTSVSYVTLSSPPK